MGKSLRNKQKTAARLTKRKDSFYAREDAARTARLHEKLMSKVKPIRDREGDIKEEDEEKIKIEDGEGEEVGDAMDAAHDADMDDETKPSTTKISTSGPRDSRREAWRASKGLKARPDMQSKNRQGMTKARRKSGRPARRR